MKLKYHKFKRLRRKRVAHRMGFSERRTIYKELINVNLLMKVIEVWLESSGKKFSKISVKEKVIPRYNVFNEKMVYC